MKRSLSTVASLSALAVVVAPSLAGASAPARLESLSPAKILATTLHAASAQHSVVSSVATSAFGVTIRGVATSGPTSGDARVSANGHQGEIRDVGSMIYAKFDAALVSFEFRTSVTSVADKWIAVPATNRYFSNLALGVTLPSVLREVTPAGTLRVSRTTFAGQHVLALIGRANASVGVPGGTQTLYVSSTAPYLPVGGAVHATASGVTLDVTIRLAKWGVGVHVRVPSVVTPISATSLR